MLKLAVRTLAEFVHRRGDLHARLDGRTRAEEGMLVQRAMQKDRPGSYVRERPVCLTTELAGVPVTVAGRIDGCDVDGDRILVEEFKTTRADPEVAHGHHGDVHWAQARLYAALLVEELETSRDVELRLLYCDPDSLAVRAFSSVTSAAQARAFLQDTLAEYERWLARQNAHERQRNARLRSLEFPYPEFRPFQRAMARRVYAALRDREHLLLEAPTGSGKTAATLFPALRALEASGYRRVLFLTSRTTGALAARDAVSRVDPDRGFLRHATITARERACFLPGTPCEPDACPYARGYYDRSRAAVVALLARRAADPDTIAEVAREHRVCPFELSLDTASWCDLVVGDYNYVFDPVVRLQRFSNDPQTALLVDESHQLAPRVRDMLSLALTRRDVKDALAEPIPDMLARRVKALDRALTALKRRETLGDEKAIERPEPLIRCMQRFVDEAATGGSELGQLPPATLELLFNCARWLRSEAWYHPERFLFLASADRRAIEVRLACVDPGPYIRERLDEYGGHVRFSGTVSPLSLYARLHGEADGPAERAGNPFSADQLRVLVVDDVPTYLRQRRRSAPALATLIHTVTHAHAGHYLVAFPSFEYLNLTWEHIADPVGAISRSRFREETSLSLEESSRSGANFVRLSRASLGRDRSYGSADRPPSRLLRQTPGMTDDERAGFLAAFHSGAPPTLGFVVLGGVFGESVDFSEARLAGVICVGVGLPPPSVTRTRLERHFCDQGLDGAAVAYHQPAMVKVLQMAGRLLRSPDDRGVLCLVDGRFRDPAYQQFFPDHWQPNVVRARQVAGELALFWNPGHGFSRLRALERDKHPI